MIILLILKIILIILLIILALIIALFLLIIFIRINYRIRFIYDDGLVNYNFVALLFFNKLGLKIDKDNQVIVKYFNKKKKVMLDLGEKLDEVTDTVGDEIKDRFDDKIIDEVKKDIKPHSPKASPKRGQSTRTPTEKISIPAKIKNIISEIKTICRILKYLSVKNIIKHIFELAARTLKAIKPREMALKAKIGLNDPYNTAKIIGYIYALCGIIKIDNSYVTGNFAERQISLDARLKGVVQLYKILWQLIRFALKKEIRRILYIIIFKRKQNIYEYLKKRCSYE